MKLSNERLTELFHSQSESRGFGDKDDELIDPLLDTIKDLQAQLAARPQEQAEEWEVTYNNGETWQEISNEDLLFGRKAGNIHAYRKKQASQPPEAQGSDDVYRGPSKPLKLNLEAIRNEAFQRGQQAMAEKFESRITNALGEPLPYATGEWILQQLVDLKRSLAGAATTTSTQPQPLDSFFTFCRWYEKRAYKDWPTQPSLQDACQEAWNAALTYRSVQRSLTLGQLNHALMIARWRGDFDPTVALSEINKYLAVAPPREEVRVRLDEARCIFTNWNVADRDFERWYHAHIAKLEAALAATPTWRK